MSKIKYIFTVLFSFLVLISCSKDEESTTVGTPTLKLTKIEQKSYFNSVFEEKNVIVFENQKPYSLYSYDATNQLTFKSFWEYTNGKVSAIKGYLPNGTLYLQSNISYNSSNRITQISTTEDNTYLTTTNFTYNGNTITSNRNSNGSLSSKIFEINSNGYIDKEIVNGNVIMSVQFDNLTPISKTKNSITYNYTYLSNGLVPFSEQSIYGSSPINVVLSRNSLEDTIDILTNKLITNITTTSQNYQCEYTLNSLNFPTTKKEYYNGVLVDEITYFYQ